MTPAAWKRVRLGEHITKIGSGITPLGGHASYQRSGIPLIRSQNVLLNKFAHDGLAFISPEQDQLMAGSRVFPGDVLLNITGASIGRVCMVPSEVCPANVNQHVSIIRCKDTIDAGFLSLYLSTPAFQTFIRDTQAGATRQALTKLLIENFLVPLAGVEDQRRIAAEIHEKFGLIDQARAAAMAQLGAAKTLPSACLREVFGGPEAQKWPREVLAEMARLLPSKSIATAGDTEVRAITTACLTEQGFDTAGIKAARMWSSDAVDSIVGTGEVLVARSNTAELVGRAATYNGESNGVVASDLTIRIMPQFDVLSSDFLGRYLAYLYLTGTWREQAGGASGSMKKITRTQILRLRVPVPKSEDQERICAHLGSQLNGVRSLVGTIGGEEQALATMQNAILRKAFNGEA